MDNPEARVDVGSDLRQISEKIVSTFADKDEQRFYHVLKSILQYFSWDTGTLHAFNHDDQHLYLIAASDGIPDHIREKILRIPMGKGIAGTVAATRKPVSICNLQTDSSTFVQPGAKDLGVQGSLCIPLLQGETLKGTLGVAWKAPRDLTELEMNHLLSIGCILAKSL